MEFKTLLLLLLLWGAGDLAVNGQARNLHPIPKIVSKGVITGSAITLPKPQYPVGTDGGAPGITGAVNVQVVIDGQGNVISAKAISGPPVLRPSSEAAALQAKFKPTLLGGHPVKVLGVIVYDFTPPNYEQVLLPMGLGMALNLPEMMEPDGEEEFPSREDRAEILRAFPFLAKEIEPLSSLKDLTKEQRLQAITGVAAQVEGKLTGADAWQFAIGKHFAGMMAEFVKHTKDKNYKIDENVLRSHLLNLKELLKTAPETFPPVILEKFKDLAELADKENLTSAGALKSILDRVVSLFNIISPD